MKTQFIVLTSYFHAITFYTSIMYYLKVHHRWFNDITQYKEEFTTLSLFWVLWHSKWWLEICTFWNVLWSVHKIMWCVILDTLILVWSLRKALRQLTLREVIYDWSSLPSTIQLYYEDLLYLFTSLDFMRQLSLLFILVSNNLKYFEVWICI